MEDQFVVVDDEEENSRCQTTNCNNMDDNHLLRPAARSVAHVISVDNGCINYTMGSEEVEIRPLSEHEMMDKCGVDPRGNQCLICGSPANGIHFGALSCAACNAFFRRSVSENRKYVCRLKGNCVTDCAVRCFCRACRLKKCIAFGMDAKAVQPHRDLLGPKRRARQLAAAKAAGAAGGVGGVSRKTNASNSENDETASCCGAGVGLADQSSDCGSGDDAGKQHSLLISTADTMQHHSPPSSLICVSSTSFYPGELANEEAEASQMERRNKNGDNSKPQMKVAQMLNSPKSLAEQLIAFSQRPVELATDSGKLSNSSASSFISMPYHHALQLPHSDVAQLQPTIAHESAQIIPTYSFTAMSPITLVSSDLRVSDRFYKATATEYPAYKEISDASDYLPNGNLLNKDIDIRDGCRIDDSIHQTENTTVLFNSEREVLSSVDLQRRLSPFLSHQSSELSTKSGDNFNNFPTLANELTQRSVTASALSMNENDGQTMLEKREHPFNQPEYQQIHQYTGFDNYNLGLVATTSIPISNNNQSPTVISLNNITKNSHESQLQQQQQYFVYEYENNLTTTSSVISTMTSAPYNNTVMITKQPFTFHEMLSNNSCNINGTNFTKCSNDIAPLNGNLVGNTKPISGTFSTFEGGFDNGDLASSSLHPEQQRNNFCKECDRRSAEINLIDETQHCYRVLQQRRRLHYCNQSLRDLFANSEPGWSEFSHSASIDRTATTRTLLLEFLQSLHGFSPLSVEDKVIVTKKFMLPFMLLERCYITYCMNGEAQNRIYRQDYTYIQLSRLNTTSVKEQGLESEANASMVALVGKDGLEKEDEEDEINLVSNHTLTNFPTSTIAQDCTENSISEKFESTTQLTSNEVELSQSDLCEKTSLITEASAVEFRKALKNIIRPMAKMRMSDFEFFGLTLVLLFDTSDESFSEAGRTRLKKLRDQLHKDWFIYYSVDNDNCDTAAAAERIGNCVLIISSIKDSIRSSAENFQVSRALGLTEYEKMFNEFLL